MAEDVREYLVDLVGDIDTDITKLCTLMNTIREVDKGKLLQAVKVADELLGIMLEIAMEVRK
jgi:hypothetical protein